MIVVFLMEKYKLRYDRFFVYQKPLKRSGLEYKITFWICVSVLWIHKGHFALKKWCEMFVLKLSGIWDYKIVNNKVKVIPANYYFSQPENPVNKWDPITRYLRKK